MIVVRTLSTHDQPSRFTNVNDPSLPYIPMLTLRETPTFKSDADQLWSETERLEFFTWLSLHPEAGDVIPGSGGCRKVRWTRPGIGKRGGVRVIYFIRRSAGEIWLLLVYRKSLRDNIPAAILRHIRETLDHEP